MTANPDRSLPVPDSRSAGRERTTPAAPFEGDGASGQVAVIRGDARALPLPDASADAIVCDPPYGLEFMGSEWDAPWKTGDGFRRSRNAADAGRDDPFGRTSRTSPEYTAGPGFQAWCRSWAAEALRVLKPGGHLAAFGGTRTYHRMACAVEDAGFEIRDSLHWIYGSGFPKSLDVGKAIDAARWDGWGTALKPAHEPIILARKPLNGTVAANVLAHGTGALNIDACRVGTGEDRSSGGRQGSAPQPMSWGQATGRERPTGGRWPANVVFAHSASCEEGGACTPGCPVAELDRQSGVGRTNKPSSRGAGGQHGAYSPIGAQNDVPYYADEGGASRFFPVFRYEAKAGAAERPRLADGTAWPTVKPVALMRWLVRLITPPGGLVLDPFTGTGTTGEAARADGFRAVLIDQDPTALVLTRRRLTDPPGVRNRTPPTAAAAPTPELAAVAQLDLFGADHA